MGTRGGRRDASTATPTDNRIVAPQFCDPDPGTPNAKSRSRHGEADRDGATGDRCKGMEQPERLQGKITLIFAVEALQGRLRSARGRFYPAVFFIA